ncbi:MAG: hypothetical protein HC923_03495, partial [Myxococcales bacterium]|nr:hypothetical protein [Myxococcales bacterium]
MKSGGALEARDAVLGAVISPLFEEEAQGLAAAASCGVITPSEAPTAASIELTTDTSSVVALNVSFPGSSPAPCALSPTTPCTIDTVADRVLRIAVPSGRSLPDTDDCVAPSCVRAQDGYYVRATAGTTQIDFSVRPDLTLSVVGQGRIDLEYVDIAGQNQAASCSAADCDPVSPQFGSTFTAAAAGIGDFVFDRFLCRLAGEPDFDECSGDLATEPERLRLVVEGDVAVQALFVESPRRLSAFTPGFCANADSVRLRQTGGAFDCPGPQLQTGCERSLPSEEAAILALTFDGARTDLTADGHAVLGWTFREINDQG